MKIIWKGFFYFYKLFMFKVLGRNDFIDNYLVFLSFSVFKVWGEFLFY